jgi:secondary thiamine-phosphate synthase enzyme
MKSHTKYLTFHTRKKREYINITAEVETAIRDSSIQEGMVLVSAMHITAGVFINDNESGFLKDLDDFLERLTPEDAYYRHHQTGEVNGDAHLKNIVVHHQVIIPVTRGLADLGPWQQVFYAEFDGRRDKRLIIKVMGE